MNKIIKTNRHILKLWILQYMDLIDALKQIKRQSGSTFIKIEIIYNQTFHKLDNLGFKPSHRGLAEKRFLRKQREMVTIMMPNEIER